MHSISDFTKAFQPIMHSIQCNFIYYWFPFLNFAKLNAVAFDAVLLPLNLIN